MNTTPERSDELVRPLHGRWGGALGDCTLRVRIRVLGAVAERAS
jgi:hypothetical protein